MADYPMADYPEHQKIMDNKEAHEAICAFVEWLEYHDRYAICERYGGVWDPISRGLSQVIAEYFGIDYDKFQNEKEQMLTAMRALYQNKENN
jgi:hypothetical protein